MPNVDNPNEQKLGHGTQTFAAIQVTDEQGGQVALGIDSYRNRLHSEENALTQIRFNLDKVGLKASDKPGKGWRVTVVVDQTVARSLPPGASAVCKRLRMTLRRHCPVPPTTFRPDRHTEDRLEKCARDPSQARRPRTILDEAPPSRPGGSGGGADGGKGSQGSGGGGAVVPSAGRAVPVRGTPPLGSASARDAAKENHREERRHR